ncbi:MAG: TldD/PmbA family protein [Actinomycetota bacterium]|nr:TldD/PmbA family protein [Actinomycetota bacterium]
MERTVDEDFTALPLRNLADAALARARDLGAGHADLRVERVRTSSVRLRDGRLAGSRDDTDAGLAVRVLVDGVWGFAAATDLTPDSAVAAAEQAVALARVSTPLASERVELADEPVHADVQWVSAYDVDPFEVPSAERAELLAGWSGRLLASGADHVEASVTAVKEQKFYADLAGTSTVQQRVRINPDVTVVVASSEAVETMRSLAPGTGRGWEYLAGTPDQGAWGWDDELPTLPELAVEKLKAPSVEAGAYDLVLDPSNLWLTIHESIGHATELDRALGYEAAYAGTSFATIDQLGSLQYGSEIMHVTGERTAPNALATVGYDDEGVQTQAWDIVRGGVLVGYQLDRAMARQNAGRTGVRRSNGCAFADSSSHVPIQRMANVNLQPAEGGPSTEELIAGVDRGVYVVGDKSWSIDMQRYNFQFTGQRFYRIEHGRLAGMLRDVAYQATTTDFWRSMTRVGGPQTYVLGGAFNCGKGQPGQVASVSHGCPAATFRQVRILNTSEEGRT